MDEFINIIYIHKNVLNDTDTNKIYFFIFEFDELIYFLFKYDLFYKFLNMA
jgi:hypothetical protein